MNRYAHCNHDWFLPRQSGAMEVCSRCGAIKSMRRNHETDLSGKGWAVFNRGTPLARIKREDEVRTFVKDEDAIKHCINNVHDPICLLALCETFATDPLVRMAVENNLYRSPQPRKPDYHAVVTYRCMSNGPVEILAECASIESAETIIELIEEHDADGVHKGLYGIDATEEEEARYQQKHRPSRRKVEDQIVAGESGPDPIESDDSAREWPDYTR